MVEEIGIFDSDGAEKEIIHIENSIPDLALEYPHVGGPIGYGNQPGRYTAHQEQVKIIERKNSEKQELRLKFRSVPIDGEGFVTIPTQ